MNVYCIADNILSPLGATTAENYEALREGRSLTDGQSVALHSSIQKQRCLRWLMSICSICLVAILRSTSMPW